MDKDSTVATKDDIGFGKNFDFDAMIKRQRAEFEAQRPERVEFFREKILPTFIDQWPKPLHSLSVPTAWVPFPVEQFDAAQMGEGDTDGFLSKMIDDILPLLLRGIPGAFFRLGSRAPKDWWYGHPLVGADRGCTQPRNAEPRDIAESFMMSERVSTDILDAQDASYEPQLCARAWLEGIEPHREFRCFMRGGELAGISVYRAWEEEPKPQIVSDPKRWESAIREWFPAFRKVAPLDDLIFDTVVLDDGVVLLEINPYLTSTYPAHFLKRPLDGRFRYIGDGDSEPAS